MLFILFLTIEYKLGVFHLGITIITKSWQAKVGPGAIDEDFRWQW